MKKLFCIFMLLLFISSCWSSFWATWNIYVGFAWDVWYYDFDKQEFIEKKWTSVSASWLYDDFDISWDNKKILLTMDVNWTFNFDERRYVLRKIEDSFKKKDLDEDGKNLIDNTYEWWDISYLTARISPDEKYLALEAQHFSDLPITIIDTKTWKEVSQWEVKWVSFLKYWTPTWTLDNSVYFKIWTWLYKSSPSDWYKSAPKILDISGASYVSVSPDWKKVVYVKDEHLWLSNIDWSDMKQITKSKTIDWISWEGERLPTFSPDWKYIAFTSKATWWYAWSDHNYPDWSYVSATSSRFWYLTVIPADWKLYDLDDKNSWAVFPKNSDWHLIPSTVAPIWRE